MTVGCDQRRDECDSPLSTLDCEQRRAVDLAIAGKNVFLTGGQTNVVDETACQAMHECQAVEEATRQVVPATELERQRLAKIHQTNEETRIAQVMAQHAVFKRRRDEGLQKYQPPMAKS